VDYDDLRKPAPNIYYLNILKIIFLCTIIYGSVYVYNAIFVTHFLQSQEDATGYRAYVYTNFLFNFEYNYGGI